MIKIWNLPSLIITILHENAHAKQIIKANKQLDIKEKIIIIIGCRALLYKTDTIYKIKEKNSKIIVFLNNWWSYTDNVKSIGYTECKNRLLYNDKQVINMAKAGNKAVFRYTMFLLLLFIINAIVNGIYIDNLILLLFSSLIFFWLAFPGLKELKDYKNTKDYKFSINPDEFISSKSEYVEIARILQINK